MVHQEEAGKFIGKELPELNERFEMESSLSLFKTMRALSDYTQDKVEAYDMKTVSKCFSVVDNLYKKGDTAVQNAIENVYVYALERILGVASVHKAELMNMIPESIHAAYIRQMIGSHM